MKPSDKRRWLRQLGNTIKRAKNFPDEMRPPCYELVETLTRVREAVKAGNLVFLGDDIEAMEITHYWPRGLAGAVLRALHLARIGQAR